MAQGNSENSTTMPVVQSRRRFLPHAAGLVDRLGGLAGRAGREESLEVRGHLRHPADGKSGRGLKRRGGLVRTRRKGKGAPRATAPPATPEPAIYYKTPVTPEEAFQAIGRLRKEARDEIDKLIRFLDETDNHMEREPDDEADESELEQSLGSFDRMADQSKAWRQRGEFCSGDHAQLDNPHPEPSLGSVWEQQINQEAWAAGNSLDLEPDG